jgi:hypothetical protein
MKDASIYLKHIRDAIVSPNPKFSTAKAPRTPS